MRNTSSLLNRFGIRIHLFESSSGVGLPVLPIFKLGKILA